MEKGRKMYLPVLLFVLLFTDGTFSAEDKDTKPREKGLFESIVDINTNEDATFDTSGTEKLPQLREGDIVVNAKLLAQIEGFKRAEKDGTGLFDAINRGQWPKGIVPYTYANRGTRNRLYSAVNQAVGEYNTKTCIRWKEYSSSAVRSYRNYVTFFIGGGCFSMIGRQSRAQRISLGRGCETKGVAIHEMMHCLGFFHEQSRRDRDSYITINWRNIPRNLYYNFEKYRPGQADTLGEGYDKQSIMHYGNYAFSTNRRMTIVSKQNRNERLGQRIGLSKIDVRQLRKYYRCGSTGTTKPKKKKPTKPTTGSKCKDKYTFCKVLGTYCIQSWVKKNCKKQCNQCTKPKRKKCINENGYCNAWQKQGYCTRGTHVEYMKSKCKKACRLCN